MKIKKYIADSFKQGRDRILAELGEEAVILSTRDTKKPDGTDIVEIVAAIDEKDLENKKKQAQRPVKEKMSGLEEILKSVVPETKNPQVRAATYEGKGELYDHIFEIKNQLRDISKSINYKFSGSLGPVFGKKKLYANLQRNELSEPQSLDIVGQISSSNPSINYEEALLQARHIFSKNLKINHPLKKTDSRQVVVFTGTTGSGKTMSLVKIAIVTKLVLNAKIY